MDLSGALKIKAKDVKEPPLPPLGHYRFQINEFKFGEVSSPKGQWDTIDYPCVAVDALEDVDQAELAKAGGIRTVRQRVSFMFPKVEDGDDEAQADFDRTMFFMKRFLSEHCGVDADDNTPLAKMVEDSKGCTFIGEVTYREDKERGRTFAQIGKTMPITADV